MVTKPETKATVVVAMQAPMSSVTVKAPGKSKLEVLRAAKAALDSAINETLASTVSQKAGVRETRRPR